MGIEAARSRGLDVFKLVVDNEAVGWNDTSGRGRMGKISSVGFREPELTREQDAVEVPQFRLSIANRAPVVRFHVRWQQRPVFRPQPLQDNVHIHYQICIGLSPEHVELVRGE
jgi:hypothetical protein